MGDSYQKNDFKGIGMYIKSRQTFKSNREESFFIGKKVTEHLKDDKQQNSKHEDIHASVSKEIFLKLTQF